MSIRTIEDDYTYRMKAIIKKMKEEFEDWGHEQYDGLEDFLWNEAELLGKAVIEDMEEYCGLEELE